MQDSPLKRRFIAGAVCPRCALMDKIVVDLETDQRMCVSCGFSEARPGVPDASPVATAGQKPAELPTRVSRAAARRLDTPAQAVTFIDAAPESDGKSGQKKDAPKN